MNFKFVFGKKGYGKTQYILDEIKKDDNDKVLIIVPSHNTFMVENRIIEYLGESILSRVEVMDFKKLTFKLLSIFKGKIRNKISNVGKSLLINYILRKYNDDLIYFSDNHNIDFSDEILSILIDFKSYNITNEIIKQLLVGLDQDSELYKKLYDLMNINDIYEKYLNEKYLDSLDDMKIVNDIISKDSDIFRGYNIYIDGFEIFTYYQYEFLKIILNRSNKISMSLTLDNKCNNIIYNQIKIIKDRVVDILLSKNCYNIEEIYLEDIDKNKELKYLDKNYLNYKIYPYTNEIHNIYLNKCLNNYYEVEELCKKIRYLVLHKGYRYKDIGVICRDIDSYENFLKVSFDEFNIPYFIDKKNEITSNIFSVFISSIFEIFDYDFSHNALFKYIKSGLVDVQEDDIFLIENFSIENGIIGNRWKKDFSKHMYIKYNMNLNQDEKVDLDRLNAIRRKIIDPLINLFNKVKKKNTTNYFIKEIYRFLEESLVLEKIRDICEEFNLNNEFLYANELVQIVNNIFDVLDEINNIFKFEIISFSEFGKILIDSISKIEISHIPMRNDEILIGDIPRLKIGNYKVLFVIGCNSINFPKSYKKEDLINDLEKKYINKSGFDFSGTTVDKNLSENYLMYSIINIPKDMLYISYSISDMDSISMSPSILISKIKKIFKNLKEENTTILKNDFSIENIYSVKSTLNNFLINLRLGILNRSISPLLMDLFNFYNRNQLFKGFISEFLREFNKESYKNILDIKVLNYIYQNTKFSISSIESYSKCSFKHFLDYIIRIKKRRLFSFEPYDYGNIMHFLMEHICMDISKIYDFKNVSKEELERFIEEYFSQIIFGNENRNFILNNNFKFRAFGYKIKKIITDSIFFTGKHLVNSEFFHKFYEFEFGKNNSKISLQLDDGREVLFTGKVDRIDFCTQNNETFINIIDYKSSNYDVEYGRIYKTLNIQTIAYMNYVIKLYKEKFNRRISPCGIFYFTINRPLIKNNRSLDIKKELSKNYRYKGIMVDDIEKLKLIDKNIINGNETLISLKVNKNGELSKNSLDKVLCETEFCDILHFVHNRVKETISKIYNGEIAVYPILEDVYQKKCTNCDYVGICKFVKRKDNFHVIRKLDKSSFFNLIRKENQ